MAEDSTYGGLSEESMLAPSETTTTFPKENRWRPTGLGNYFEVKRDGAVFRPSTPASARMYAHGLGTDDRTTPVMKLWVNEIVFGWAMDYKSAQAVFGKSFYPRHIKYSDVVVRCQTASQQHYDEIVYRAIVFQGKALQGESDVVRFHLPRVAYVDRQNGSERFSLAEEGEDLGDLRTPPYVIKYRDFHFDGYITSVKAGHTKAVFAPEIELRFAVVAYVNDNLTGANSTNTESTVDAYRKSLDSTTSNQVTSSQLFESGYGPGGNQGPRGGDQ